MPNFTPTFSASQVFGSSSATPGHVDVLSQLQGAEWRGIGFPCLMFEGKFSHNLAIHKRVDRDGWRVENTGMNGGMHSLKIPCVNNITPGTNETWSVSQPLYPVVFTQLMKAFADRTSGTFTHPMLGKLNCKVESWGWGLDPDFRGGPTITASLFETLDDDADTALDTGSPQAIAVDAAANLDTKFAAVFPAPNTGTPGGMSLSSFLNGIGTIADEWNLAKAQWSASIDRVVSQMQGFVSVFGGTPGFSDDVNRLISALHAIKAKGLRDSRNTSIYIVPGNKPTTLAVIANRQRNSLADIIRLNPQLAGGVLIQPTTAVRYYT